MATQLRNLSDEELSKSFALWADRIERIASTMCGVEKDSGTQHPCTECIRLVHHVTGQWKDILGEEYNRIYDVGFDVTMPPRVAYLIAGSTLEPTWGVAVDPIGPL